MAVTVGGMLYTTQWTQVILGAFGSGASGSSTISTRLFTPSGTPDHASGGEVSLPTQVHRTGISWPSENALDVSCKAIAASACGRANMNRLQTPATHGLHFRIST